MVGLKTWLEAVLGFFYLPVCQLCLDEGASAGEGFVGARCRRKLQFIELPFCERCGLPFSGEISTSFVCGNCHGIELYFESARAVMSANAVLLDVIHRYKYRRHMWLEPFLSELLVGRAGSALSRDEWDALVPVPLHPVRHREREFNQAERLARHLAVETAIPVRTDLLRRVAVTKTQTALTRGQRHLNVRQAFALKSGVVEVPRRVVLVDDVLTTGATTNACARVLRRRGAARICVWTLARGV